MPETLYVEFADGVIAETMNGYRVLESVHAAVDYFPVTDGERMHCVLWEVVLIASGKALAATETLWLVSDRLEGRHEFWDID